MTPQRVDQAARRFLAVAIPVAAALLVSWAFRLVPDTRPFIFLMLYLTMLLTICLSVTVMVLARLHIATASAFAAGYRTGARGPRPGGDRPELHLVE